MVYQFRQMYVHYEEMVNELSNNNKSVKKCVNNWINGLDDVIDCIDNPDDESSSDSDMNMDNINELVKEIVKTLMMLKKNKITLHKQNKQLLFTISKLITRHLFVKDVEISDKYLLYLLKFINWDCALLFQHAEDWATSEEDAGSSIVDVLDLAAKYDKKITGVNDERVIYALLMAVHHCENELAENFIIENNVKLTKGLREGDDGMISDMTEYFEEEKNYDLIR